MIRRLRSLALVAVAATATTTATTAQGPTEAMSFERDAQPILRKHCGKCHNAERPLGELDLSTFAGVMAGGASGKVAVAGKPEESTLYTLTAHLEEPHMPPNVAKIPQRDLGVLRRWVEGGLRESANATGEPMATSTSTNLSTSSPAPGGLVAPVPMPHAPAVAALAASPVAPLVAVPGHRQVLLFDGTKGEPRGAVGFPEGDVLALRFSRDGRYLLAAGGVGAESGRAVVFRTEDWARVATLGDESDAILAADLDPAGTEVVHGGPGRAVKLVAVPGGAVRHAFRKATDWVTAAGFSPDGLLVGAGDRFGGLFVWEVRSGKEFLTLRGHTRSVNALAWLRGGDRLATVGEDGTARVWDMHSGTEVARWDAHPGGALTLDVAGDGRIITGGRDKHIRIWDEAGKPVADLGPAADHVTRVAWSGDGRWFVAGDWSGEVRVWDPARATSFPLAVPVVPQVSTLAMVAPVLSPARPGVARPVATPVEPAASVAASQRGPADEIESALRSAREAEAAASRAVGRLVRLQGRTGQSPGPDGATVDPAALTDARTGLESLRAALARTPSHSGLRLAVEAAEEAVRSLETARP